MASMFFGNNTLHLLTNPVALPAGRPGVAYRPIRIVLGGVPGYHVRVEGDLPAGLELSDDGYLRGTPTTPGLSRFLVRVFDSSTPPATAHQAYTLRVLGPLAPARPASAPASAASAPRPPRPITELTPDDTRNPPSRIGPTVWAWQLTQADLDKLVPDPGAPATPEQQAAAQAGAQAAAAQIAAAQPGEPQPAGAAPAVTIPDHAQAAAEAEAVRAGQQRQMLATLLGVEFPSRGMFEAALDTHMCQHVRAMIAQAERAKGLPPSGGAGVVCPPLPPPPAPARAASGAKAPAAASASAAGAAPAPIPVAELPNWLLPPALRKDVVAAAEKRHALADAKPSQWTDGNCGCVHEDMVGETYGFYPFWAAEGKPQQVDFSLLTRIGFHAATFGDDGSLRQPASWSGGTADFALQAERHGTRLDLVVWRNDWKTLLAQDEARLDRAARELARNAVEAADVPLRDRLSWVQRFLPFTPLQATMADGITVFFDNAPDAATDPVGTQAFAGFVRKFMLALIAQMRANAPRPYALNVALNAAQFGSAPFDLSALYDYIRRAEDPRVDNQRISGEGDVHRSQTNVTVRFVALLPEPTVHSKKALRKLVDDARDIHGNDRRILLRKIVAAVSADAGEPQQFADDMAYFRDNFGGAGFWRMPIAGTPGGDALYGAIGHAFRKDATQETSAICKIVCINRLAVRALFQLLVAVELLALVGVAAAGGVRCVGRRYVLALILNGLLVVFAGGSLLNCDPEFRELREGNILFWSVLALLFLAALAATLRPRDPRP
jgi:hypothetical protein